MVSNSFSLREWEMYLATLKEDMPFVTIEDGGETIRMGELSPGCMLCKEGKWDCLFLTPLCNLSCTFCISPLHSRKQVKLSVFGRTLQEIASNHKKTNICGIGYSGGEALMAKDELVKIHKSLKAEFPSSYYWLYTNGLLLNKEIVNQLSDIGMDEIRFNTAATDYNNTDVLHNIDMCACKGIRVSVEVPLIFSSVDKLIHSLQGYVDAGVSHLNLHDLMRESHTPSQNLPDFQFQSLIFKDGHQTEIALESRLGIIQIFEHARITNLPLNINYCSIFSKARQIRKRRNIFAALLKKPYQKIVEEDTLEYILVHEKNGDYQPIHPDDWDLMPDTGNRKYEVVRTLAPLSIHEKYKH